MPIWGKEDDSVLGKEMSRFRRQRLLLDSKTSILPSSGAVTTPIVNPHHH